MTCQFIYTLSFIVLLPSATPVNKLATIVVNDVFIKAETVKKAFYKKIMT